MGKLSEWFLEIGEDGLVKESRRPKKSDIHVVEKSALDELEKEMEAARSVVTDLARTMNSAVNTINKISELGLTDERVLQIINNAYQEMWEKKELGDE